MSDHLLITVDYELFGDGSGCVQKCVVEPTARLLALADGFGVPITLFVDATEFIRLQHGRVASQLRDAVRRGHDVQIHVHPQWFGAAPADGGWKLDSRWRLADRSGADIAAMLTEGVDWLQSTLSGLDWKARAFRAGGWAIRPSEVTVAALLECGLRIDSTVAPGRSGPGFDFGDAPALPFWRTDGDVCAAGGQALWEVPIATAPLSPTVRLRSMAGRRLSGVRPAGCHKATAPRLLGARGATQLDYCGLDVAGQLAVIRWWRAQRRIGRQPTPIVAIGHSKDFGDFAAHNLRQLLRWTSGQDLTPSTYGRWLGAVGG